MKLLSHVQLFATSWTVAYLASLSMGFSRQEYWSGCRFLLQGIFLTQGLNPGLPPCRQTLYPLSHQGIIRDAHQNCNEISPYTCQDPIKRWQTSVTENVRKGKLCTLLVGMWLLVVQPLWKSNKVVPQKIKSLTIVRPSNSTSVYWQKLIWRCMHPFVHCTTIYNYQDVEAT